MNRNNLKLSAIVIAKNEEARIGACIDSVSFADEIIVADNGSTDGTIKIARERKAIVKTYHTPDFAKLRNEAALLAHGKWLLYIDADEIVSEQLAKNIRSVHDSYAGYELYRKNYYFGRLWPIGEWKLRLFQKKAFRKWYGALHETPSVEGNVGKIDGDLFHDTHRTLAEMVAKTNEWSETEARLRMEANHPPITWWRIFRVILTAFWDSYIKQGGWRVGTVGIIESMYQGFSIFVTYAKLWELQQKKS